MDEVIFEEFKGTGNSEIILDRKVSDKRVFPAIDVSRSGTRKEDLLVPKDQLKKVYVLRRILNPMGTMDGIEFLIDKLAIDQDQRRVLPVDEHVAAQNDSRAQKAARIERPFFELAASILELVCRGSVVLHAVCTNAEILRNKA